MWGTIQSVGAGTVPCLQPGEVGLVSVALIAPEEPGHYQRHWRLSHHGERFGHRVWCSIVVVARETLEVTSRPSAVNLTMVQQESAEEVGHQLSRHCLLISHGQMYLLLASMFIVQITAN